MDRTALRGNGPLKATHKSGQALRGNGPLKATHKSGQALYRKMMRIDRISAWLLLPVMIMYIITGYVMLGWFGLHGLVDKNAALLLHIELHLPLLILFILHAGINVFFYLRRKIGG